METQITRIRKYRRLYRLSRWVNIITISRLLTLTLIAAMLMSMGGCRDAFQYSPNEVRLKEHESDLNKKNIARIQAAGLKDSIRFVVFGDTQRFYDELEDFVNHMNAGVEADFVILTGDITDFGLQKEFTWITRELNKLKVPFIVVPGNHDYLGNGKRVFDEMFGPENFTFKAGDNYFVCMNTNSIECSFDGSVPDVSFLRSAFSERSYSNAFVVSHIPPHDNDFDQNLVDEYRKEVSQENNVKLSIHGHQHRYTLSEPFNDGVPYLVTASTYKRNYALVTVAGEQVSVQEKYY